jgi:DNA-directed RNA polymerase specialized sigma24 family protein
MGFWSKYFPSEAERNRHLFGEDEALRSSAFSQLMENHLQKVVGVLRKMGNSKDLAEEIAQEAFSEYLNELNQAHKRKEYATNGIKPIAILITKAKSLLGKHFRKEKKIAQIYYEDGIETADNEKKAVYFKELSDNNLDEEINNLQGIFGMQDLLEVDEKIAMVMEYFKEKKKENCYNIFKMRLGTPIYSLKEIGNFLNKTEAVVKTDYQRCRDLAEKYLLSKGIHLF